MDKKTSKEKIKERVDNAKTRIKKVGDKISNTRKLAKEKALIRKTDSGAKKLVKKETKQTQKILKTEAKKNNTKTTGIKKRISEASKTAANRAKNISHTVRKISHNITHRHRKPVQNNNSQNSPETDEQKVLMFGWELPPFNSGGLGVACYDLADALSKQNANITFVLPKRQEISTPFMKLAFAEEIDEELLKKSGLFGRFGRFGRFGANFNIEEIDSPLSPYLTAEEYELRKDEYLKLFSKGFFARLFSKRGMDQFSSDMIGEVYRYAAAAAKIAKTTDFDVIHAHDWLSFPAGITAKKISKKPFIAQVHALEQDRSPSPNPAIVEIEKEGLEKADKVIAISHYVKNRIMQFYHIPENKIEVVHNGSGFIAPKDAKLHLKELKKNGQKIVLSAGRITYQKGIDYLVTAAAKAMVYDKNFILVIVGSGDMRHQIIQQAASLGISDRVFFPGFLRSKELEKLYQAADLFVMPSVSEPFGLVAAEAAARGIPIIISKQSGIGEVINHSLKVDFWDVDELANKITAVLHHKTLRDTLIDESAAEVSNCTWDHSATKCMKIYQNLQAA